MSPGCMTYCQELKEISEKYGIEKTLLFSVLL